MDRGMICYYFVKIWWFPTFFLLKLMGEQRFQHRAACFFSLKWSGFSFGQFSKDRAILKLIIDCPNHNFDKNCIGLKEMFEEAIWSRCSVGLYLFNVTLNLLKTGRFYFNDRSCRVIVLIIHNFSVCYFSKSHRPSNFALSPTELNI